MVEGEKKVRVLERETVYHGFFDLHLVKLQHSLYGGGWSGVLVRELFQRGECAAVLPYDPARDAVVLIEQFRVGTLCEDPPWLLEIVAGAVEEGESPDSVARREAFEEAGCRVLDLVPMFRFYSSPGGSSERVSLYCGRIDSDGVGGVWGIPEEGEDILVRVMRFTEAMKLLDGGRIHAAIPLVALQWLARHRAELRGRWGLGRPG